MLNCILTWTGIENRLQRRPTHLGFLSPRLCGNEILRRELRPINSVTLMLRLKPNQWNPDWKTHPKKKEASTEVEQTCGWSFPNPDRKKGGPEKILSNRSTKKTQKGPSTVWKPERRGPKRPSPTQKRGSRSRSTQTD